MTPPYSSLMLDPLTAAEIQALRLKLQLFASRQTDATVRSQCLAVHTKLAEVLEGDDPILRQILANSVEQLVTEDAPEILSRVREDGADAAVLFPFVLFAIRPSAWWLVTSK